MSEPNPEDLKKNIEEFIALTEADEQTAIDYLKKHVWRVVDAINDYFDWMYQQNCQDEEEEEEKGNKEQESPPKPKKTKFMQDESGENSEKLTQSPTTFRHITYNIDSLNEKNLKIRVQAICKYIETEKASFAFFQEVRRESEEIIRQKLSGDFEIISGMAHPSADYYTLTLVQKKPWIKIEGHKILPFSETSMGRNILQCDLVIGKAKVCLLNTHLESTKEFEASRKKQLAYLIELIRKKDPKEVTVIAGGDLNLRDKELDEIGGLPIDIQDAWIATGRRKEVQYTWDMLRNDNLQYFQPGSNFKPRMRFDRVLFRRSEPTRIDLLHFGLIGLERLKPHVCFPSDHWGVITTYQVLVE